MERVRLKSNANLSRTGRPAGAKNKIPTLLKVAIITAAERVGEDGKGKEGLTGYLTRLAKTDQRTFGMLLGKVLPLQVVGADNRPLRDPAEAVTPKEMVALYMQHLQQFNAGQAGEKSTKH